MSLVPIGLSRHTVGKRERDTFSVIELAAIPESGGRSMDDEVNPTTAPVGDLDPLQIVYDIVHTPLARVVMSRLYHGQNLDDLDESGVTHAVDTLQALGMVGGGELHALTDQGQRLQAVFEEIESSPK